MAGTTFLTAGAAPLPSAGLTPTAAVAPTPDLVWVFAGAGPGLASGAAAGLPTEAVVTPVAGVPVGRDAEAVLGVAGGKGLADVAAP